MKTIAEERKMKTKRRLFLIAGYLFLFIGVAGFLVHPRDDTLMFLFGLLIGCGFFIIRIGLKITITHESTLEELLNHDYMQEVKPRISWFMLWIGICITIAGIALMAYIPQFVVGSSHQQMFFISGWVILLLGLLIILAFLLDCWRAIKIVNRENEKMREAESKS